MYIQIYVCIYIYIYLYTCIVLAAKGQESVAPNTKLSTSVKCSVSCAQALELHSFMQRRILGKPVYICRGHWWSMSSSIPRGRAVLGMPTPRAPSLWTLPRMTRDLRRLRLLDFVRLPCLSKGSDNDRPAIYNLLQTGCCDSQQLKRHRQECKDLISNSKKSVRIGFASRPKERQHEAKERHHEASICHCTRALPTSRMLVLPIGCQKQDQKTCPLLRQLPVRQHGSAQMRGIHLRDNY